MNSATWYMVLLRATAACMVILLHSMVVLPFSTQTLQLNWLMQQTVTVAAVWAVPVFIMLSGALLLPKVEPTWRFYSKRFWRIGIPSLFWFGFYAIFNHLHGNDSIAIEQLLNNAIHGTVGHLYFLFIIIQLYILTPVFRQLYQTVPTKHYIFLTILFFYIAASWGLSRFSATLFIPYLGYYLVGPVLALQPLPKYLQKYLWHLWIICGASIVLTIILGAYFSIESYYYLTHGNPLIACFSICTFLLAKYKLPLLPASRVLHIIIQQLSEKSFGMYLIHQAIILLLTPILVTFIPNPWIQLFALFFSTVCFSYCITAFCMQKKYLHNLV